MTENSSLKPSGRQDALLLLTTFLLALVWVSLVLRGGWSLGFFLAILLTECLFVVWLLLPPSNQINLRQPVIQIFLAVIVLLLALSSLLYSNLWLKLLNILILLVLIPLQYLLASGVFRQTWDQPGFWLELGVSLFLRPFISLGDFFHRLRLLFSKPASASDPASAARSAFGRVFLGILLAVPVLLIAGSLLSSADPIFAQWISRLWQSLSLGEIILRLVLTILLLPFIFSFLISGKTRAIMIAMPETSSSINTPEKAGFRIDRIVLLTFLTLINLLYLAFALVQLTYLAGAFQAVLPEQMTYAEYARSGFFELAGLSAFNVLLVLVSVKGSERKGTSGVLLMIESLLLIFGSLVQWASAIFRMKMYVDVFGLSLMRFWVVAFMLLMLVLFLFLTIKIFKAGFPFFKSGFIAALSALVLLNFVNCDLWIARHNAGHYQVTGKIDTEFFRDLSAGAVPVMLELAVSADRPVAREMASQLIARYQSMRNDHRSARWQSFNISNWQARQMISAVYDDLLELTDGTD